MTRESILQTIIDDICELNPDLSKGDISGEDSMANLGLNSMDRAEVLMNALRKLNLQISRVELFGPRNIGELADLLLAKSTV